MKAVLHLLPLLLLACASDATTPRVDSGPGDSGRPAAPAPMAEPSVQGWLAWRGPLQCGLSLETDLPERWTPGGENHLWTYPLAGRGTPVIANGRLYTMGYEGQGADLEEMLACFDAATGKLLWDLRYSDFLSDITYNRYAIASPAVDPETGNLFFVTAGGLFNCVSPDGALLWQHDLMAEFGRLTFPNGRTGAPVVDGELVIFHMINSHWGPNGPARDRVYAFEKDSGTHAWTSVPGETPVDNSFAPPVFEWRNGRRVLYFGTGCGNLVGVDALAGDPLWRFKMSVGGLNSAALLHGEDVIAIHGRENIDSSVLGRMVAVRGGTEPAPGQPGPVVLEPSAEVWRNGLVNFSSSPVMVGERAYVTAQTGELCSVDLDSGQVLWSHKLSSDQIHASPVAGDGKLYVPMNNGMFFIVRPSDAGPEVLSQAQLEGNCLGAPAICAGRVYVQTTENLYCFGKARGGKVARWPRAEEAPEPGSATRLQVRPGDVLLRPGDRIAIEALALDAKGLTVARRLTNVSWAPTPGLAVRVEGGGLVVADDAAYGVGLLNATSGELKGSSRLRIVPREGFTEDFEGVALTETDGDGTRVGRPPAFWLSGWPKWDVRELEGSKVLAKTLHVPLFQRATSLMGHPDASDYTMQVDVRTDGNRRTMSNVGVIHQRYMIELKGNHQQLEISSNQERIKEPVAFSWKPDVWYTLKTRVDVEADGTGVVRAKAWPRDEAEPTGWNLEVPHAHAHTQGPPGLFGFALQSRFRVYVDNISVTSND